MSGSKGWKDSDIELWISRVMRYGIVLASVIVVTGCVIFLINYGSVKPEYSHFTGEPEQLTNVFRIVNSIGSTSGKGLIEFGLVMLIAIPIIRVAFSLISFAVERDRAYVLITLAVFILLLFSVFGQQ
jgi:uncharacterized membrane protein